jgi:hypothetical protein
MIPNVRALTESCVVMLSESSKLNCLYVWKPSYDLQCLCNAYSYNFLKILILWLKLANSCAADIDTL